MNQLNSEYNEYTEIYQSLHETLKIDKLDPKTAITTAKRLTDAIWDLHLVLNTGDKSLENTVSKVKHIVGSRITSRK